jgi:hypothetical protein
MREAKFSSSSPCRRRCAVWILTAFLLASCGVDSSEESDESLINSGDAAVQTPTVSTLAPEQEQYEIKLEQFSNGLTRTLIDRPDDVEGPMMKFLYVVPSFARDQRRDTSGEIARYVFHANEWIASQNGGFGVRVDTFNGALDIPYVEISVTEDEWASWFDQSLAPAATLLQSMGWPIGQGIEANGNDVYYVIWEAAAGNYKKTGASGGSCRPTIDADNAGFRMVGYAVSMPGGAPCGIEAGRFPFGGSPSTQQAWLSTYGTSGIGFVDHALQMMRKLPGCGYTQSPRDGESFVVPGTNSTEIRGGFIRDLLDAHDPIAMRMPDAPEDLIPELDYRHDTYFHITTDRLARTGCNSDAARHPMWSDTPFYDSAPEVPRRSVLDRPDDVSGPQIHAVYVRAKGTPDRALDTGPEIPAVMRRLDEYMRLQTGGTGIRIDTYQAHVDVTYLPLPKTAEEYVESGTCLGERCPSDIDFLDILRRAGYGDSNKWYVFFYDGGITPNQLCGGAKTGGRSMLINLDDFYRGSCEIPWIASEIDTWSLSLLVGHELFHSLGAVCSSAPDVLKESFHSSIPGDLMYERADGPGIRLDINRDSYWGNGAPSGCDKSAEPIFTAEPNAFVLGDSDLPGIRVGAFEVAPSPRTWWLIPPKAKGDSSLETPTTNVSPTTAPIEPCPSRTDDVALIFSGSLRFRRNVANESIGLIWNRFNGQPSCLVATAVTDANGGYSLELTVEAFKSARWEDGGGYCVVWDENADGEFDVNADPVDCRSELSGEDMKVDLVE